MQNFGTKKAFFRIAPSNICILTAFSYMRRAHFSFFFSFLFLPCHFLWAQATDSLSVIQKGAYVTSEWLDQLSRGEQGKVSIAVSASLGLSSDTQKEKVTRVLSAMTAQGYKIDTAVKVFFDLIHQAAYVHGFSPEKTEAMLDITLSLLDAGDATRFRLFLQRSYVLLSEGILYRSSFHSWTTEKGAKFSFGDAGSTEVLVEEEEEEAAEEWGRW